MCFDNSTVDSSFCYFYIILNKSPSINNNLDQINLNSIFIIEDFNLIIIKYYLYINFIQLKWIIQNIFNS